jgi:catechol 2,3-dioxygenase-like lactoylglutathione lyase family enzyme
MKFTGINHLAFITNDMVKTIRFYRDLLGLELVAGIGNDGYRHYFFELADGKSQLAFFEYEEAGTIDRKFPGERTAKPLGFDHVSLTVESKEDLFGLRDTLVAAGIDVHGAVDHGMFWSIYFYDPNNIPLEASWQFMDVVRPPAMSEVAPMEIVAEGSGPQPGHWPEVTDKTAAADMVAKEGNALPMRKAFLDEGSAKYRTGQAPIDA